jgi:hypothetical protein
VLNPAWKITAKVDRYRWRVSLIRGRYGWLITVGIGGAPAIYPQAKSVGLVSRRQSQNALGMAWRVVTFPQAEKRFSGRSGWQVNQIPVGLAGESLRTGRFHWRVQHLNLIKPITSTPLSFYPLIYTLLLKFRAPTLFNGQQKAKIIPFAHQTPSFENFPSLLARKGKPAAFRGQNVIPVLDTRRTVNSKTTRQ